MRPSRIVAFSLSVILMLLFVSAAMAQTDATAEPQAETTQQPASKPTATRPAAAQATPTATAGAAQQTYTVRYGDNLFRIALRFGTTTRAMAEANGIVNPNLIFTGQVLNIPSTGAATPTATATAVPPTATPPASGEAYVVQRGDTLLSIASRFSTTVSALIRANNIPNQNIIFTGQRLTIPAAGTSAPTTAGSNTDAAAAPESTIIENAGFAYGIEAFAFGQDLAAIRQELGEVGANWVKVRVDWRALEPVQGEINFAELDGIVDALNTDEFNILLTVTNSPTWARTAVDENGPPDDLADYGTFVGALAARYADRVDAYEVWDEPNLRRNWRCDTNGNPTICDIDYVELLTAAYDAVKSADSSAMVITGGLAPTGFNDGINAINDRIYLATILANGAGTVSDAIGAHPGGWANPPDAVCCDQSTGVETHFEDASFYFLDNLEAYRQIMIDGGNGGTPIWVTKFGWGSSEDGDAPSANNVFYTYTSLSEQALYVPRAFELGQGLGYVGPMILDNLNGCQGLPSRPEACYAALIAPDGQPRPLFEAVASIEKPEPEAPERPLPPTSEPEMTPEATPEATEAS